MAFNINASNGLPDSYIYRIITDRYGYMWICTPKGVARYNGYEFKTFGVPEGLPFEDIWNLCEDRKGRIWLGSIANEIGYIYNDKYHRANIVSPARTLYPRFIRPLGNGISFNANFKSLNESYFFIEKKDTIFPYIVPGTTFADGGQLFISQNEKFIFLKDAAIYQLAPCRTDTCSKMNVVSELKIGDAAPAFLNKCEWKIIVNNHIVADHEQLKSTDFLALNITTGVLQNIELKNELTSNEVIEYIYPDDKNYFYVITTDHIFRYDTNVHCVSRVAIKQLINENYSGAKIKTVLCDSFWNNCIGTVSNGMWINYNQKKSFFTSPIDLHNFKSVGSFKDSLWFWWNQTTNTLAVISGDLKIQYITLAQRNKVFNIGHFKSDSFIISANNPAFFTWPAKKLINTDHHIGLLVYKLIRSSRDSVTGISAYGFYTTRYNASDTFHYFDYERYEQLEFDSLRNSYWAYNNNSVYIHQPKGDIKIADKAIQKFGVKKIQKIVFDNKYGNIFFKGYDNITLYNYEKNSVKELFAGFNLKTASLVDYNNWLIVVGRFGILFTKILGRDSLSAPLILLNIKDIKYQYVYDFQASRGKLLLNTDKGAYEIAVPSDSMLKGVRRDVNLFPYKLIVNYKDTLLEIHSGDTVLIDQKNMALQFDIINPYGNGKLKYKYKFDRDSVWHDLNADELVLPSSFEPDRYYTVSVVAIDNNWESTETGIHFYIKPYWWQTHAGRELIWATAIVLILLLFTVAVLITRKLVLRADMRRNMQRELELKAIYAQINPHFIFNTLNSALLLVRKQRLEEAYNHISQFSRLLRSYIKSSRNKLISISEEIINLSDYLELQRTRFANKFEYSILVEEAINPERVKIPSLLIQPFVENALNHGLLPQKGPGALKIEFVIGADENEIVCRIDDNGIGRKAAQVTAGSKTGVEDSYGSLLIKDLTSIFNKYERMNIDIRYVDKSEPLTGTTVIISIKNPHYS